MACWRLGQRRSGARRRREQPERTRDPGPGYNDVAIRVMRQGGRGVVRPEPWLPQYLMLVGAAQVCRLLKIRFAPKAGPPTGPVIRPQADGGRQGAQVVEALLRAQRLADIYFGEFMRVFSRHYARYLVRKLSGDGEQDPNASDLKTRTEYWPRGHFRTDGYKAKRRRFS